MHPEVAPIAVYVVLTDGVTTIAAVVKFPGIQVYEPAPDAVNVALEPAQTLADAGVMLTIGIGVTDT